MSNDSATPEAPRSRRDKIRPSEEAAAALGGAPLTPPRPSMKAGRVAREFRDRPDRPASRARENAATAPEGPARVANPLFDSPDDDSQKARTAIHQARKALGHVARLIESAVAAVDALPAGEALNAAAARESFDLAQAKAVRDELAAFLDRHKPVKIEKI